MLLPLPWTVGGTLQLEINKWHADSPYTVLNFCLLIIKYFPYLCFACFIATFRPKCSRDQMRHLPHVWFDVHVDSVNRTVDRGQYKHAKHFNQIKK